MIGPAAVFLLFSFLLLYTSPGGWRGRAKPISSTRHPGRSGVTFHLISNNVIINNFSFHSLDWTNVKKKCAVPVACGPHSHVFYKCILTHMCTHTYTPHTIRCRLACTVPVQCWEETRQEYSTRLKRCCEHINDEHDVDALCRAFPKRCKKMEDAQGGRLSY